MGNERRDKGAELRRALQPYRGGRFETGSSGGAGGMVFFRDAKNALFYIGGFNPGDAQQLVRALNASLEYLQTVADVTVRPPSRNSF